VTHRIAVALTAGLLLILLAAFIFWPLARILLTSVTARDGALTVSHYGELFTTWRDLGLLLRSLALAATTTAITVGLAVLLAFAVLRTAMPGRPLVSGITLLTLIAPPFLASLALVLWLGQKGLVTRWLGLEASIEGFSGLVVAQVLTFLPHAYLLIASVLATVDGALEDAAENLGAGEVTILGRVTLALARPGLVSAALAVFVLSLVDFANPIVIGGRYGVLATEVYSRAMWGNTVASAATLGVALLGLCLAAYLLNAYWIGARASIAVPVPARAPRPTARPVGWGLAVVAWTVALAFLVVYGTILLGSVVTAWGTDWSPSATHYVGDGAAARARSVGQSLRVAGLAAVFGTMVSLVGAYLIERMRPPGARALAGFCGLPAALPGTVVGLGYLLAFHGPPVSLTGTIWAATASVVFWKLPVAGLAATAALRRVNPGTEETAVSLGAGTAATLLRVTLPLLAGTALVVGGYFFIEGVITVSPMVFLIYPGFTVGSVEVLLQIDGGRVGAACAETTLLIAIVWAVVLVLLRVIGRERVALLEGLTMKPGFIGRGRS